MLMLLCAGCQQDGSPGPVAPAGADDVIMPLQVGNSWILRVTEVDTNHLFLFASSDTVYIDHDTALGGRTWFADQAGNLLANRADGLWKIIDGLPVRTLAYPGNLNDSSVFTEAGDRLSVKIIATNPLVSIHIGEFTCVAYRTTRLTDGMVRREDFYAPGVGPISSQLYDTLPGRRSYVRYYVELAAWQLQ